MIKPKTPSIPEGSSAIPHRAYHEKTLAWFFNYHSSDWKMEKQSKCIIHIFFYYFRGIIMKFFFYDYDKCFAWYSDKQIAKKEITLIGYRCCNEWDAFFLII